MSETTPASERMVEAYFAAMRRGPEAETDLLELFSDDAIYIEPFTRPDEPAVGKSAVQARLREGWAAPPPDMELDVLSIEVTGEGAVSRWECRSPAFPASVRGTDRYEFTDGLISRLEVSLDDHP